MNIACIFAGGTGSRMNSKDKPKQFLNVYDKPIIAYTIDVFEKHADIDAIVIACKVDWIDYLKKIIDNYNYKKVKKIVEGGETGQLSIYNALKGAKEIDGSDDCIVLIHDGVRPLIDEKIITNNILSVKKYGSAITTSPVQETILIVNKDGEIISVPCRDDSRVAKAPQSFKLKDIFTCHENALKENKFDYIDSCSMMKHYGFKLHLVDGPNSNIKITTPEDFYLMKAIIDSKENRQLYNND